MARAIHYGSPKASDSELEHYYLDIIDSMPGFVYLLDKNCCLTGSNKNFRQLFDLKTREEAIGEPLSTILLSKGKFSNERTKLIKQDDINVIVSKEAALDVEEKPVVNGDNEIVYYQSSRIPLLNNNNEVIGLLGIFTDITEMKKMRDLYGRMKKDLRSYDELYQQETLKPDHIEQLVKQKTPKVLMVEDNSTAQKATQALLMQLDCHVDIADSGDKATELFEPGKYDLVFMDIGLEGTSGYVVSKHLRQLEEGTGYHVPIIALTGFQADIVKYDCDDYSMEGALTKPLTSEQAKQIIEHYIYHIDIPVHGLKTIKDQI